jgi:ClpA/ClpB-like protein
MGVGFITDSDRLKNVLMRAHDAAIQPAGRFDVGDTLHLLFALLIEGEGVAIRTLSVLDVDLPTLRASVEDALGVQASVTGIENIFGPAFRTVVAAMSLENAMAYSLAADDAVAGSRAADRVAWMRGLRMDQTPGHQPGTGARFNRSDEPRTLPAGVRLAACGRHALEAAAATCNLLGMVA